jgi:hypothetical protein
MSTQRAVVLDLALENALNFSYLQAHIRKDKMRLLLAPIAVTPTKALTPSHLKGLLWVDVLFKATARLHEIVYLSNRTTFDITSQTLGYWEYLDRVVGPIKYEDCSEEYLGELYIQYQASPKVSSVSLAPYREKTERGWLHPASRRILEIWQGHYQRLGLYDPGLLTAKPFELSIDIVIERLSSRGMCIDTRTMGGSVYLDLTAQGLPLRQVINRDGQDNYLMCLLRELLPMTERYDKIILVCDEELTEDYLLVQRILNAFGACVSRVVLGRAPLDGVVQSSRHGGWQRYTVDKLFAACADSPEVIRLAFRLCLIACLGRGSKQLFHFELLRQCVGRARRLLDASSMDTAPEELQRFLSSLASHDDYVDAYRITSALFSRKHSQLTRGLLSTVFA